jgi:ribonucleoside-diphosphate reductase alpha chain
MAATLDQSPRHGRYHRRVDSALARHVWETRYRYCGPTGCEPSLGATWDRVAAAVAQAEPEADRPAWTLRFRELLGAGLFLPGGRIIAGAGTGRHAATPVTLLNCFVMGPLHDEPALIDAALEEGLATLRQGGGVGWDFSTLRPQGTPLVGVSVAAGPVAALRRFDEACRTQLPGAVRRPAMMGVLRCDHPDIEAFIDAKREPGALSHFNLSVLVTDELMSAVARDRHAGPWRAIAAAAHASAEPGVLFVDRINALNNTGWCERLSATNPCGELPLPPYGGCDLGSMALPHFVREPFAATARLDFDALGSAAAVATRFLDDVIDVSGYPLARQRDAVLRTRRIGLGITGLADALAMLGLRYDSQAGRDLAAAAMRVIHEAACRASTELAAERGPFPAWDAAPFLAAPGIAGLPERIRHRIEHHGMRNSHVTAIAPAGSISLLGGNLSTGIEPLRPPGALRSVLQADGTRRAYAEPGYAIARWQAEQPAGAGLPDSLVFAGAISAADQLRMLAALQPHVDSGISKTVELPAGATVDDVAGVYALAWELGLKGCAVYRAGSRDAPLETPAARCAPTPAPAPGAGRV